jgi:integrase
MARQSGKLKWAQVKNVKRPGMHGDGAGLWLHVGATGGKSWVFRYMINGKAREMGLGPVGPIDRPTTSLEEARDRAQLARRMIRDDVDPLKAKEDQRKAKKVELAKAHTFKQVAAKYIAAHRAGWRNAKHAAQWDSTLTTYAYPIIGDLPVGAVDTGHVTRILEPIWATKPETAARVRGRIESVLDYAGTHQWRTGENPARWKGHLQNVLPTRSKVAKVEHHASLPWQQIAPFMADLERQEGVAALALRFAILTAARTGEVIGVRWSEIDTGAAVWTVPGGRMKGGREHRVSLSESALAVVREAARLREREDDPQAFLFPGGKRGKGLSNMALLALLRRMARGDLTAHGFRSTFRDWAAETGQPADIAEAALAHVVGDKTVAAYQRGDLLERRRKLMDAWATFCGRLPDESGQVVELRRAVEGVA